MQIFVELNDLPNKFLSGGTASLPNNSSSSIDLSVFIVAFPVINSSNEGIDLI